MALSGWAASVQQANGITKTQVRVAMSIGHRMDERGVVTDSYRDLAAYCGVHKRTFQRAVRRLEALGLLVIERPKPGRGHKFTYVATVRR